MSNGASRGSRRVDTFQVALLGSSLITIIVFTYSVGYLLLYFVMVYQGLLPEISAEETFVIEAVKELLLYMFILPQSISLVLWYVMPSFIKDWYTLEPLPSQYSYVHSIVRNIASRMGVSPPSILYTRKNVANCFNLGKRGSESTIVVSKWLVTHLDVKELEAVLTHEMAHTKNKDVALMAYFAAVKWVILLSPFLIFCGISSIFPSDPFAFLLYPEFWILIAPFLVVYLFLVLGIHWFSRVREVTADARTSLFVDKSILKNALYKLSAAKTTRMQVVPSCLMVSSGGLRGVLFTHPTINKRFKLLNEGKYVVKPGEPPSLRSLITLSVSIFIFIQLINYIVSTFYVLVAGNAPHGMFFLFFDPSIAAVLLVVFYGDYSWKHLGVTVFLIAFLQFITFYILVLPFCLLAQFLLPSVESLPPVVGFIVNLSVDLVENLSRTTVNLLKGAVQTFIITFLIIFLLKYAKKYLEFSREDSSIIEWGSKPHHEDSDFIHWESDNYYEDSDFIHWDSNS